MKQIIFITSLFCCAMMYNRAIAQDFWYVPPGADYSYRYGIDLGNGVGYGYGFGFGYGSTDGPNFAIANAASDLVQFQRLNNPIGVQASIRWESFDTEQLANQELPALQGTKKSVAQQLKTGSKRKPKQPEARTHRQN